MVRFDLKIAVTLLLTEEKCEATFDLQLRLSIKKACGAFENQLRENSFDGGIDFLRLIRTVLMEELIFLG